MDEMRIGSAFMRGIISKLLRKMIRKKSGYDIGICLNKFEATVNNGKACIHMDLDAELEKDELIKILKNIGLD